MSFVTNRNKTVNFLQYLTIPTTNIGTGSLTISSSDTSVLSFSSDTDFVGTVNTAGSVTITVSKEADNNFLGQSVSSYTTFQEATSSSSSGDPYITTFKGLKYKLPNIIRNYRLLEYPIKDDTLYINASVSQLKAEEKQCIIDYNKEGGIVDGFYYDKFFIGTKNSYAVLDRQLKLIESNNLSNYSVVIQKKPKLFLCPIQGKSQYVAKIISIEDVKIELRLYSNPQILNGIEVSVLDGDKARGILNSNINPKNFILKNIKDRKDINVNKLENKEYNKDVKEHWIRCN